MIPETKLQEARDALSRIHTPLPWKLDCVEMYLLGPEHEMVADTNENDPYSTEVALRIRGHGAGLPQHANGKLAEVAVNLLPELLAENEQLRSLARIVRDGFDCDSDAHKYGTMCRACAASEALR